MLTTIPSLNRNYTHSHRDADILLFRLNHFLMSLISIYTDCTVYTMHFKVMHVLPMNMYRVECFEMLNIHSFTLQYCILVMHAQPMHNMECFKC